MQRISLKKVLALVFVLTLSIITGNALADAPLPPPAQYLVCSNDGKHCAVADLETVISVYEIGGGRKYPLWNLPKWHRWGFLANGGHYFVAPYYGYNLLALKYKKSTIMLKVWRDGKFQYSLELKDLIKDFGKLERTVSHYYWGLYEGFDADGKFIINTVEKRRLAIDIKTGKITEQ